MNKTAALMTNYNVTIPQDGSYSLPSFNEPYSGYVTVTFTLSTNYPITLEFSSSAGLYAQRSYSGSNICTEPVFPGTTTIAIYAGAAGGQSVVLSMAYTY